MKKILFLFLFACNSYAQPQVFNVQHYCVDQAPLQKGQCDVSGNEYSFVFLDDKKHEVTFFFTNSKLRYTILESQPDNAAAGAISYALMGANREKVQMKINAQKTKIEFLYPKMHIYLTVGKSTKRE